MKYNTKIRLMKFLKVLSLLFLFILGSCVSVSVHSDYEKNTDFSQYKTYAFYKKGIDKVEISDLDKRRILRAIKDEMNAKGMVISENPDLLVNIFTKSREKIDVYNNSYYGWYPYYYGYGYGYYGGGFGHGFGYNNVSTSTEGTLFIDLIDTNKKELVWQGIGTGVLSYSKNIDKKEARIREFVSMIMAIYPPDVENTK